VSQPNQQQKGFLKWLAMIFASALGGWALMVIAESRIADMETTADMATYSWLNIGGGLLLVIANLSAIATLIYGRRHEAEIREHRSFSRLLTVYRFLFWLSVTVSLLAGAFLIWVATHMGPVR